jgi:phage-related protein (TIGR01555 family)
MARRRATSSTSSARTDAVAAAPASGAILDAYRQLDGGQRLDAWANILAGFGTTRDKRTAGTVNVPQLTDIELRQLWRGDDMAARAIETVPNEMYREGYELLLANKEQAAKIAADDKRLRIRSKFKRAKKFERAYGGGALWPIVNDGVRDFSLPLGKYDRIRHLRLLEPRELRVAVYDEDINSETFGEPLIYDYWPAGGRRGLAAGTVKIHRSRLLIWPGKRVSNDPNECALQPGWGDSILVPMHEVLRDFGIGWSAAAALLVDFSQGVYSMQGLADMIAQGKDELVLRRLVAMDMAKSTLKAIVIDKEDSYQRQQTPINGLPDTLDRMATRLAASARLPLTQLMGQSPKGLGNEGQSDIAFLYDQVASEQDDDLPLLEQMYRMLFAQTAGPTSGKEPEGWGIRFCSLEQQSEKDIAQTRKLTAEADEILINSGQVSSAQVARTRFGAGVYNGGAMIDIGSPGDDPDNVDPETAAALEGELRSTLGGAGTEATKPSDTAMNGGQITSLLEIVDAFNQGRISKKQAAVTLRRAFQLSPEDIDELLDESFEAAAPPAPPPMGGGKPPVPGADDEPDDSDDEAPGNKAA